MMHSLPKTQHGYTPGTFLPFYLPEWQIQASQTLLKLTRTFAFDHAIEARQFAGKLLSEAVAYGYKPSVHLYQKWVCVVVRLPIEEGIHISDCILPALADDLYHSWSAHTLH